VFIFPALHGRLPRVEHTATATSPAVAAAEPVVVVASETVVSQTWTQQQQQQQVRRTAPSPSVAEAPRFSRPLQDISAPDGSEVTLTCVVNGRPSPTISWYHNGRCIDRSTDFAISYDEQSGRAELVIVDCMVDDRGQFRCVATNPAGQTETACTLTVLPPADSQSQQQPKQLIDVDMSEEFRNASAQLQQQAGAPGDGTVQPAGAADGQAPKFVQPIQPCVVVEGDTCTFTATVSGDPAPEIVWLKEKQDLVLTDRHAVSNDPATGQCSLTIRLCSSADTGVYSCRASNTSGRATCTANVVVVREYMTS
jgi:titin